MTETYSAAQMLASAPTAMALVRGARAVALNDAFVDAVGHSREALMAAEDLFTLVAPEDQAKVRARYAARQAGKPVPSSYELDVIGADGVRRRIELEPRVLAEGETLLTLRPLADAARSSDLLRALAELQARCQRERSVRGVLDTCVQGLRDLGVCALVVRMEGDLCRMMAQANFGRMGEIMAPVVALWESVPGLPNDKLPRISQVIVEQRAIILDDMSVVMAPFFQAMPSLTGNLEETLRFLSQHRFVITPLAINGQPWGAVVTTGPKLASPDLAALSLFSQQLGAMIEVAQSIEALEKHNRLLDAIHRVARLRTELSVEALVPELLRIVAPATDSDEAAIFLTEPNGEWLTLAGTTTPDRPFAQKYRRIPVQKTATGQAILTSAPRALSVEEWPAVSREDVRAEGYKQLAIVPLVVNDRMAGTLNLSRRRDERYDLQQLRDAEMLLGQIALQLERARHLEEARRRVEDLSLVNEVGSLIVQQLDLSSVTAVAMSHVSRLVVVQNTFLFLFDEATQQLRMVATNVPADPLDMVLGLDQPSAATDAAKLKRPVLIEDAEADPCASKPPANRYGHKALLAVPLLWEDKPIGALVLGETGVKRRFTGSEIDRAVAIANQLATAIVNARLFEKSKESYRRLEEAQAELVKRERLAALGELSAVVAHEVRNPVAVIFNSLAGIQKLGPIHGDLGELLGIVHEEAERLNRMVSDLLDFASPFQAKKRHERLEPLLADTLKSAAQVAPGNVKLSLAVQPELGEVPVDPQLLRQAVMNLLVNAMQAMPEGGEVLLRALVDERGGRRMARIDVVDDGPGICPTRYEQIFQPFFTTRAKGTGLGLAVVKRIADAHQAEVAVKSNEGKGATFSLWLPV